MKNGIPELKSVRAALERDPSINLHRWPVALDMTDDRVMVLAGEVQSLAAKKRALELAGGAPDVHGVVDRLFVVPAERKGDGEMQETLLQLLLGTVDFRNCTVRALRKGQSVVVQAATGPDPSGDIGVSVADGVVALDGWVISLSHKRMLGALAWWVPGCRDVRDALEVLPPEEDNDDEITDALSLVLERDPMILHPEQIRVGTHDRVVTLEGLVGTETERTRAEQDAWCLFDVGQVVNRLVVSGP